jgi:PAS domain S-box-containing protein
LWVCDYQNNRSHWFGDLKTMFGLDSTIFSGSGEDFLRRIHPDDYQAAHKAMKDARENRKPYVHEFRVRWADGTVRWVLSSGRFHYSPEGEPDRMLGIATDVTDYKLALKALLKAHEGSQLVMQASRIFAYEWDPESDEILQSHESSEISGLTENATGTAENLQDRIHPKDQGRFAEAVGKLTPDNPSYKNSVRVQGEDDRPLWLVETGCGIFDSDGQLERVFGMIVDVTDRTRTEEILRKREVELQEARRLMQLGSWLRNISESMQARAALGESEERFRLAMNNIASGVFIVDRDGVITYVNAAAEAIFGWKQQDLLGTKIHETTHYQHSDGTPFPASECPCLQVLQTGVELREQQDTFFRKDGSFFTAVYNASPLKKGNETIGLVIGVRDDSLRRLARKAIRESEARFRLLANTAPVKIWMSGVDGTCTYFNECWLTFVGRSLSSQLGNGWQELVHPEDLDRCRGIYLKAFDQRAPYQMEYRLRRHDGEYRWVLSSAVPRLGSDDDFAGYIGSAVDVTELKLAGEALSAVNQRLIEAHEEERTLIARELHDDINQRLALLAVNLDCLNQVLPSSPAELHHSLEELTSQLNELASHVQALSHRLHSSKLEHLGLAKAAASLCKELADRHKMEINFHSENIPSELSTEIALCMFRVVQEALQNAFKHSGSKRVEVSLKGGPADIELTVRDNGNGFDPQAAMNAGGIGLVSMKERLKLVSGVLSINSQLQRGTTIHARAPLHSGRKSAGADT